MTLVAYTGLMGSGKSYGVVANQVIPALKRGRTVVTNMPIDPAIEPWANQGRSPPERLGRLILLPPDLQPDAIIEACPSGGVVVLDEVADLWPSGTLANKIPEHQRAFFTKARHSVGEDGFTREIVLVVQDLNMLARFIQELVEFTYRAEKLEAVGATNRFRIDVYKGGQGGQNIPEKYKVNSLFGKYEPDIYRWYKSHTASSTGAAGVEDKVDGRANMLKSWRIRGAGAALIAAPILFVVALIFAKAFFSGAAEKASTHGERSGTGRDAGAVPGSNLPAAPASPPPLKVVRESSRWRLSGQVRLGVMAWFVIEDGDGRAKRVSAADCKRDDAKNWTCMVSGELVADWTGPAPAFLQSFVQNAVAPSSSQPTAGGGGGHNG